MTSERMPPHDKDSEILVLSGMINDTPNISEVLNILGDQDFYFDAHQKSFRAIVKAFEKSPGGKRLDAGLVAEELRKSGEIDDVGGYEGFGAIVTADLVGMDCLPRAHIVRAYSLRRKIIHFATDTLGEAHHPACDADDLIGKVQKDAIALGTGLASSETHELVKVVHSVLAEVDARSKHRGALTGVPSGLVDLDNLTAGMHGGELTILAARPSVGKTALGMQIAREAAAAGYPVLVFSLEMHRNELVSRMLCGESGVNSYNVRRGRLSPDEVTKIIDASGKLAPLPVFINDSPGQRIRNIISSSRRLKASQNIQLVIVDYLQLITPEDSRVSRNEQVALMSRSLKLLARDLSVPVICLSQLSRGVEHRGAGAKPQLSDLRDSGAIEQDADTVLFLHRVGDRVHSDPVEIVEAIIAKQRNGPVGDVTLSYRKANLRFENWSPSMAPAKPADATSTKPAGKHAGKAEGEIG